MKTSGHLEIGQTCTREQLSKLPHFFYLPQASVSAVIVTVIEGDHEINFTWGGAVNRLRQQLGSPR